MLIELKVAIIITNYFNGKAVFTSHFPPRTCRWIKVEL